MKRTYFASGVLAAFLVCAPFAAAQKKPKSSQPTVSAKIEPGKSIQGDVAHDPLIGIMEGELNRATGELAKVDPAPYFLSYSVEDEDATVIVGSEGAVLSQVHSRRRGADVSMRVGAPALDNTHGDARFSGLTSGALPLENDHDAIARELWSLTNAEYKKASQSFLQVKTKYAVRAKEEDESPDFSKESPKPQTETTQMVPLTVDQQQWAERVRRISAAFKGAPDVYRSVVLLMVTNNQHRFVSSEKSRVFVFTPVARLMILAQTTADDGMELMRVETFESADINQLPSDADLLAKVQKMTADVKALRNASLAQPFNGPAMLSGRAAAVFFHEVMGHRLEGQRQRGDEEGQTFTKQVGQSVLPSFLSVVDDPTLKELNGIQLAGYYTYDDEGMPASRVQLIDNGVLKNFLMSRMPVKNFLNSNGHGRSQAGFMTAGRQGNLIVTSSNAVPDAELRKRFVEEIKKQNKPYGLYFEDIQGGFTLTTRSAPQAFQVLPVMVWKVYADGKPDELVRGVDIVGTPLAALNRILVTGDKQFVFNGVCGAESGSVPVSAVAPAMLFSEIEVQRRAQGHERPPILPAPEIEDASGQKKGGQ